MFESFGFWREKDLKLGELNGGRAKWFPLDVKIGGCGGGGGGGGGKVLKLSGLFGGWAFEKFVR